MKIPKPVFILLSIAGLLLTSCAGHWKYLPVNNNNNVTIYVSDNGWHTGIVIPATTLGPLQFLVKNFGLNPYYEIGWGDAGFYQAKRITSGLATAALFWPTNGVLHVVALPRAPEIFITNKNSINKLTLSKRAYQRLLNFINRSFRRNKDGHTIAQGLGLYGNSRFYAANGTYYFANTCNTWTAEALHHAGVPIQTFMTLTASSVMKQSKKAEKTNPIRNTR